MATRAPRVSRWWLVVAAAAAIGVAGSYQFAWSSVRVPLGAELAAPEAALGTVFTVFVVFQTLSQFPAGWVRDRWGPRIPLLVGAVLLAAGYLGTARATTVEAVVVAYAVGGVGAGIAYTVAVNTPVKWFDERRGLATGAVTMTYSGLSVLLIPAIRGEVAGSLDGTLVALGLLAGVTTLVAALVVVDPARDATTSAAADGVERADGAPGSSDEPRESPDGDVAGGPASGGSAAPLTWREAVRTWQFWLLYGVFVAANGVGLMVIGKAVAFAAALDLSAAAATGGASAIALADAGGVLVIGGLSDRLGRERTVGASLVVTGVALVAAVAAGALGSGPGFVALVGAVAFFRSPVFAIFPALVGEYYGERHSSTNYAALYTGKLWGGLLGGAVASALVVALGWTTTFLLGAVVVAVGGLAAFALRPPARVRG